WWGGVGSPGVQFGSDPRNSGRPVGVVHRGMADRQRIQLICNGSPGYKNQQPGRTTCIITGSSRFVNSAQDKVSGGFFQLYSLSQVTSRKSQISDVHCL